MLHTLFSRLFFSEAMFSLFSLKVRSSNLALYVILKDSYFKGALSDLGQFFSTESPVKIMENDFYFN